MNNSEGVQIRISQTGGITQNEFRRRIKEYGAGVGLRSVRKKTNWHHGFAVYSTKSQAENAVNKVNVYKCLTVDIIGST